MITFLQMCRGVGLLLGLGLVGCTKPPVPVAVAQPRLGECRASDHAVELGLDAPALCRLATERGKLLVRNEGDPFRVKLRIVRATADASHLELVLTLEEERPDGRRIEQRAAAAGQPGSAPAELARRLTGDVLEELGARLRLYSDPPPDVVAALAATNPDRKQEAIEVCGERKLMACTETLLPAIEAFAPQLLLVSAGFDAHRLDPLANLDLEDDDYAWLSAALVAIAERHAGGRLVSTLEGGYSLTALRHAATVHCRALFGTTAP